MAHDGSNGIYSECDCCWLGISRGWMVPTGEKDAEFKVPVVKLLCNDCYHECYLTNNKQIPGVHNG